LKRLNENQAKIGADGKGYAAYSVLNFMYAQGGSLWPPINQSMYAARLTDDYVCLISVFYEPANQDQTSTDLKSYPIRTAEFDLIDNEGESPDLFYRNGFYCKYPYSQLLWPNAYIEP